MDTIEPSKFKDLEEKEESPRIVLMGVYFWGGMFTMPKLGIDGVLGVWIKFYNCFYFNKSSTFLLALDTLATQFASALSTNLLDSTSSTILLASG